MHKTSATGRIGECGAAFADGARHFAPTLAFLSFLSLAMLFYRLLPCSSWRWECRAKSWRLHGEDWLAMCVLGALLLSQSSLSPLRIPRPATDGPAHESDPPDGGAPHGEGAYADALPPARRRRLPPLPSPLHMALGILAFLSFMGGMLLLGLLGELSQLKFSLNSAGIWRPPASYYLIPALCVVALAVLYSGYMALAQSSPADGLHYLLTWCAAALLFGGGAAIVATRAPFPFVSPLSCVYLSLHPHHYVLALLAALALRCHGLPPKAGPRSAWRAAQWGAGVVCYATKFALVGIFVQGLSQYGADSILRPTTCAAK